MRRGTAITIGLALAVIMGAGCGDDGGSTESSPTTPRITTEARSQQICNTIDEEMVSTATGLGVRVAGTPLQTGNDSGDDPSCYYDVAPRNGASQPGIVITEITGTSFLDVGKQFSSPQFDREPSEVLNTGDEAAWFQNSATTNLLLAREGDTVITVQSPLLTQPAASQIANQYFNLLGAKAASTTTAPGGTTTTAPATTTTVAG